MNDPDENMSTEKDEEIHSEKVMSRLVMLQFSIDQMALEVKRNSNNYIMI